MIRHEDRPSSRAGRSPALRGLLACSAGISALLAAGVAGAAPAPATNTVSEVVVTANKLNLKRVLDDPEAIQAISGDALRRDGDAGFLDIATKIPGLSVQDLGPGDRKYIIRGVSSTGESTTGVYYDEAVISGANANDGGGFESDIRLYDLDHIEVLRGPQGTLYGADSMSGTIRFITKKPNLTSIGGYVTGEGSDTSHGGANYHFNGAVNLPIVSDKFAVRLVGWTDQDSGYIDQIRLGAIGRVKGVNNDVAKGFRVAARWQPIENLTIDASATSQNEFSNGSSRYTPAGVMSWGQAGKPIAPVMGCDLCNTDVTRSPSKDQLSVLSLTASYKLPYGTITATTNQYNRKLNYNFNSTPILYSFGVYAPAETLQPQRRDLNSSEIRYASSFNFPVNFVVGGFRQYDTNDLVVNVLATDTQGRPIGVFSSLTSQDALDFPGVGNTYFGRTDNRSTTQYAAFGEATWKITDRLTAIAGVRYFTEDLNGVQTQTHPFGGFPGAPNLVPVVDEKQTFSKTTFKFNVSYKFDEQLLAYATASQGFRGGGLNALSEPFEPIPHAFAPDSLWNYEVGGKGRLFDGRLDYQIDAYAIFWYNIQIQETTADGAFNFTGNAGNAVVKGFEFEFNARPIEHLTLNLSGSYQDAYLTEGATPAQKAANPTLGVTGEKLLNVAPFMANLGFNYTAPLSGDWKWTVAGDVSYRDKEDAYFKSNSQFYIPLNAYTLLNLRAGLSTGPWTMNVFLRNATDERAQVSAINSSQDPHGLLTVRPRTVGVNLTKTF